jgi:hypothetical protein
MRGNGPARDKRRWCVLLVTIVACALAGCFLAVAPIFAQGQLETLRQDVRTADAGQSAAPESPPPRENRGCDSSRPWHDCDHGDDGNLAIGAFWLGAATVTSPFWAPYAALGDDFSMSRSFARFPYDDVPGYMTLDGMEHSRPWAAQFSTDYATGFNDLDSVGGHLVLSTASRFGVDMSARDFQERMPGNARDNLWLGDGNFVFCFARNEQMQWRTGMGINWLNDPRQTDVGFNFTYGFDWFPRKPWGVSTEIDWGNLGRSGLFHFRGTVGVLVNRFEAYTGYEYFDFDRVHTNALIGGVRVWF